MVTDVAELERELAWITAVIDLRFTAYFGAEGDPAGPAHLGELPPPELEGSPTRFAALVREQAADPVSRLALALCLAAQLRPQLLDVFHTKNATFDRRFTEFGCARAGDEIEPTAETIAFLLDGGSVASRVAVGRLLDPEAPLHRSGAVRPAPAPDLPASRAPLRLSPDTLALVTTGRLPRPSFGPDFPAQRVETRLGWDDLVLHPATLLQLKEIHTWLVFRETLLGEWGMRGRLRPGYRALFHGPPGTGKTVSAGLLGKLTGRDVYRIDLSLVVSKYIGETEKNLSRVFERAEQRDWILLFDEADALFGKRGETKSAHDRYANQEVAYLLQRVETFDGVVILASNFKDNVDDAFLRRFESVVYFPLPRAEERLRLWQQGFSPKARLEVDLDAVARRYELSGGSILNVIRRVSLQAIAEGERPITADDLAQAIRRELVQEGKAP